MQAQKLLLKKSQVLLELFGNWIAIAHPQNFSSHGQVLYFFSSDAYQTYNARKFSHWDSFSAVDSRDLVRLKKRQKIKLQNSKFNDAIYEVTLLDGFYAGKTYFLIADELKNFIKEQINEKAV